MNGWFPRIAKDGVIISGNSGIWVTYPNGFDRQISQVGTTPCWAGVTPVYNLNDGRTMVGSTTVPVAYNDYVGSDDGLWAGVDLSGNGHIDVRSLQALVSQVPGACKPQLAGGHLGYLTPFQTDASGIRLLIIDGAQAASGVIVDWKWERTGRFYVYLVATGTYTRALICEGRYCSINNEEYPIVVFLGPNDEKWVMSGTPVDGVFVRPLNSPFGYRISGDLYDPDARVIHGQLKVVGSTANGVLRHEVIDFNAPRTDLRVSITPPDPTPEPPEPEPPDPPDPEPPDPPDPTPPDPEPEPTPPTRTLMLYVDLNNTSFSALKCEEIDNGNGTVSLKIVGVPDDRNLLCKTPGGAWETRPLSSAGGPWESFHKATNGMLVADRESVHFIIPCAEVK